MGTKGPVTGVDAHGVAVGVAPALALLGGLAALLFARPTAGFFALLGVAFASSGVVYLFVQQRETIDGMQRDLGRDRHQTGRSGGVFGAWVGDSAGEDNARRHRIAVAAVSFFVTTCAGSFATLLLAEPVSAWLGL